MLYFSDYNNYLLIKIISIKISYELIQIFVKIHCNW